MGGQPSLRATFDRLSVFGRTGGRRFSFAVPFPDGARPWSCRLAPEPGSRPAPVPAGSLLALLEADPDGLSAARAIRDLIGNRPAQEVLRSVPGWDHAQIAFLSGPERAARIRLTREAPDLALLLPMLLGDDPAAGAEPDALLARAIARRFVGLRADPEVLRATRRLGWVHRSVCVPAALACVPRDWWPGDADGREAFLRIAMGTKGLAALCGGYGFLRSSRGRWAAYEGILRRHAGIEDEGTEEGLRLACRGVGDCVRAFAAQVLYPALARAEPDLDEPLAAELRRREAEDPLPEAFSVLLGDKALPAILDLGAEWHAHQRAIDARVTLGRATLSWPVPYAPATAPNGLAIRFLADAAALRLEGDVLDHCVGGYDGLLATGASCVASIGEGVGEAWTRVSTAELHVEEGVVDVLQHRGRANREPSPRAAEALDWFVRRARGGGIRPSPEFLSPAWRQRAAAVGLAALAGYEVRGHGGVEEAVAAWSPFLRRPLRSAAALAGHPAARALALRAPAGHPGPAPAFLADRDRVDAESRASLLREGNTILLGLAYMALVPAWMGSMLADVLFALRPMREEHEEHAKADRRIREWRAVLDILAAYPDSWRGLLMLARALIATSAGAATQIAYLDLVWFLLPRPLGWAALAWTAVAVGTLATRCVRDLPRARGDLARVRAARARLRQARAAAGMGVPPPAAPLGCLDRG